MISHIITHIHLKGNSKVALHYKDDADNPHHAEHNPKQQLCGGAESVVCKVCAPLSGLTGKTGDGGEKLELAIQGLAQFES